MSTGLVNFQNMVDKNATDHVVVTASHDPLSVSPGKIVFGNGTIRSSNDVYCTNLHPSGYIQLNNALATPAHQEGRVYWDSSDHTLNCMSEINGTVLNVGQEQWIRIVNKTGSTITDGQAVYISGAQGNRPTASLAVASSVTADKTIGVATADIANNAEGYITIAGIVRGYNTSGFTAGDTLYVSASTPGALTKIAPSAPNHAARVGYALNSTNNGSILVAVHPGIDLSSLHDVTLTTPVTGQLLSFDGAIWKNNNLGLAEITVGGSDPGSVAAGQVTIGGGFIRAADGFFTDRVGIGSNLWAFAAAGSSAIITRSGVYSLVEYADTGSSGYTNFYGIDNGSAPANTVMIGGGVVRAYSAFGLADHAFAANLPFGYYPSYRAVQLGSVGTPGTSAAVTIAIGVNPSSVAGGSFNGGGGEILLGRNMVLLQPNAGSTNWEKACLILSAGFFADRVGIGSNLWAFAAAGSSAFITRSGSYSLIEYVDTGSSGYTNFYGIDNGSAPANTVMIGGGVVRAAGSILTDDFFTAPKTSGKGIKVDTAAPTFPWRDITSDIIVRGDGAADPSWSTFRTNIKAYQFTVNDECWMVLHVPHDYAPGSELFIHTHWAHASASVSSGSATWGFDVSYAKGHNQGAFPATSNFTVAQTASTTQYQHMIAEVQITSSGAIGGVAIEPDGLILVRTYLSANTINGTPEPFLFTCDIHYQSTNIGTKQKAPNFYT